MKVVYDWLKEYVGEAMPQVSKLEELLTFHAFEIDGTEEVSGKTVIDVKILPDRSSDCLSHRGIAREVAALIGTPLAHDPFAREVHLLPKSEKLQVTIENSDACPRFAAAHMVGVTIGPSPEWLKERLVALGQRSINNVVDATNYVMLALGQPLHAYDADKFPHTERGWHFGVRMAREGEEVTTLTGDTYVLKNTVQLITEAETDAPLGIAGIKGGKHAEIDTQTTSLILEAANFHPQVTRKAAQLLKLQTDASKRFENEISPHVVPYALAEVVALIEQIAGGTCEGYLDVYPNPTSQTPVYLGHAHVSALLGITLTVETIENIFSRLGFVHTREGEGWHIIAPFERTDITIAEDVIAEIGRVHGYEHVASVIPEIAPIHECNARQYYSEKIRTMLVAEGFSEVITSSFRKKDEIELQNALASDKGCLRSSLVPNIREVLDRNISLVDLLGISRVQVFEIGAVFQKNEAGTDVTEHVALAVGVRTKQQGYTPKDDVRLAEVLQKIEAALGVSLACTVVQGVGECNLTEMLTQLPKPTAYDAFAGAADVQYAPFSAYPFVSRDIALWVPQGTVVSDVESFIRVYAGNLLVRVTLFDAFTKEGRTSYAFRLIFQSMERTLTDVEVNSVMDAITTEAQNRGFTVR